MFWRMIKGALFRQKSKMVMIAFTVALGTSLATAMLNVMMDVGDKVNRELKTYGANISVKPKRASLLNELYGVDESSGQYLKESSLGKLKTIFWAFNIVDFAPFLNVDVSVLNQNVHTELVGTWFDYHLELPTTEQFDTGMIKMKTWWTMEGEWPKDVNPDSAVVGTQLAQKLKLKIGDQLALNHNNRVHYFTVTGIFTSGGDDDGKVYAPIKAVQDIGGLPDAVSWVDVSALTTPDNDLARKAAQNPGALSMKEMETWYCTAYVSSISYQIEEALPDCVAKPVRQVAESEGAILDKTKLLMVLITALSLIGSALGISNLVTASVMERAKEISLLKALGAHSYQVTLIVITDIMLTALMGGVIGYFAGIGFAQIIGHSVFSSAIEIKTMVIPLVVVLVLLVTLGGSLPSIRMLTKMRPATVLHGGH